MSSEKQSSCHECNYDEGTNLLKYNESIYYLCDDCYEEHKKENKQSIFIDPLQKINKNKLKLL